ncbi:hypothetical protein Tco_0652954 [Tanacetum coccineum]|uniref:Uncharacterized protein n=1 Tax=Tanacetum coccineum TaxID=301880 RepID=A0ABQ4WZ78_9ASTR
MKSAVYSKLIESTSFNEAEVKISWRNEFFKHQESHLQVLSRAHNAKLKKKDEIRKNRERRRRQDLLLTSSRVKSDDVTTTCDAVIVTDKEKPLEDLTS